MEMSQALYRKWRPRQWDEVVGQGHILQTLTNAVRAGRVGHAYLFAGPRGTGKTTVARIIAKAVNCTNEDPAKRPCNACEHCQAVNENRFLDLIEIDAASNTSVDDVRDLRDKINFSPTQGRYKIYIVDEVHMLSTAAFNALLKTLEEPPPHAIFVLATTEIHKIPPTVLSRCQRHEFRRLPVDAIVAHLKRIAKDEKLKVKDGALTVIARQATGSMRDAISLMDQLASTGEAIDLELTQAVLGTAASESVLKLVDAIRDKKPPVAMDALARALDAGADPRSLARQLVDYLRGLLLMQLGNPDQVEMPAEVKEQMAAHTEAFPTPQVLRMLHAFNAAAADTRGGWQPSLGLELALADALVATEPQPGDGPRALYQTAEAPKAVREVGKPKQKATPKQKGKPKQKEEAAPAEESRSVGTSKPSREGTKPAPEVKAAPSSESRAPVVKLGEVMKAWGKLRKALKADHPGIEALLNSCKPLEVRGDTLYLGFQSETVRALMDVPEKIAVAQQGIAEVLGVELQIKCVVTNTTGQLPPDVDPNGMVATAIQNGGEIVDKPE
jgi:DNA polymerase-3 subunit gamma/tau